MINFELVEAAFRTADAAYEKLLMATILERIAAEAVLEIIAIRQYDELRNAMIKLTDAENTVKVRKVLARKAHLAYLDLYATALRTADEMDAGTTNLDAGETDEVETAIDL